MIFHHYILICILNLSAIFCKKRLKSQGKHLLPPSHIIKWLICITSFDKIWLMQEPLGLNPDDFEVPSFISKKKENMEL